MSAQDDALFQRFGKVFPAGTTIFEEGAEGREMFVIQDGKVRISKKVRDVEKVLADIGPGAFFGEMSILLNKPRSAKAVVLTDSKLLVIEPKTFEAMLKGNAEIAIRLIKILADRLQEADEQIENLLLRDDSSRVVHFLTRQADKKGKPVEGGGRFIAGNKDLISAQTGTDPRHINDVLDKLVKGNLLKIQPDGFVVAETEKLRKFLEYLALKEQFGEFS
ncbi:MAG: Crp/Fnr family transcriptional regulator [Deltaproteobacteria bacterium]|nr:Crp/Fnr family transcriptional regulator [Deltaproteobacteria bacterium]